MQTDITKFPVMNPTFQITEVSSTDSEATLVIEPLEKGYGHTLGNSLRRVMLTSLPGAAITSVRINGVDHQYTTLEGMTEDMVQLILNLKQVRVAATTTEVGTLSLEAKGPAEVTAAAITADGGFEVVNKDLKIATLGSGASLKVDMVVDSGVGYSSANERQSSLIGEIPVDALFSPVVKVSYDIESTRVGRRTDFDKIVMHVITDGTIRPIKAVMQAAQILSRQFSQITDPVIPQVEEPKDDLSPEEAEVLRLTVEELDLPTRIANALRKGGFKTVGDLVGTPKNTIAKVKNLGEKSVDVINAALAKKDVTLGE